MKLFLLVLFLSIVGAACRNQHSLEPVPQTPIQKWQSRTFHNYTIDQRRSCFCPNGGELVRITVHADTIALLQRLSDSSIVQYPYYRTVDSLFAIILNPGTDSLVVRYNDRYGYPEYLDVNPQQHPFDGGFLYETTNLVVL